MNIPDDDADWGTIAAYALTFNGYHFVKGGPVELSELCERVSADLENASLDELRACLFYLQRAARFFGDEGTPSDLEEAQVVLSFIRKKTS